MAICLSCYKPIEAEKLKALPDARYCMKCAHAAMVAPSKRKSNNGHSSGQLLLPASSSVITTAEPPKVIYIRRPAVLREEIFDDGKCNVSVMKRHKKRNKKSEPSVWRYSNGGEAMIGDIVGNSNSFLWVVIEVDNNVIYCKQRSGNPATGATVQFYIRCMELIFRENEIPVNE